MTIKIKRNTGWQGMASQIQLKLNGKEVASIGEKQSIEIDLPDDYGNLKVSQFGIKSNEIEVKDGDIIEIKSTLWSRIAHPLMIFIIFLTVFISDFRNRLIIIFLVGILTIISMHFINGFDLIKHQREEK